MTSNTSQHPVTSVETSNPGGLPTMTSFNVTQHVQPTPEPDSDGLFAILDLYGQPDPTVIEKLKKSYKDKRGNWQEVELDYIGHATQTKWLIETDPLWNWEPVAWENGRPKIHIQGETAEMWIRLTVLGKTVIGVGTAPASKNDLAKELIGDALRNAGMRLGYALKLWSKGTWEEHPPTPTQPEHPTPDDLKENPYAWAEVEFATATSLEQLDIAARLVRPYLTDEEREQLRPLYLEHKAALGGDQK